MEVIFLIHESASHMNTCSGHSPSKDTGLRGGERKSLSLSLDP